MDPSNSKLFIILRNIKKSPTHLNRMVPTSNKR